MSHSQICGRREQARSSRLRCRHCVRCWARRSRISTGSRSTISPDREVTGIADNADPARLRLLPDDTRQYLELRYQRSLALLEWDYSFWDDRPALLRDTTLARAGAVLPPRPWLGTRGSFCTRCVVTRKGEDVFSWGEGSPATRLAAEARTHGWVLFGEDGELYRASANADAPRRRAR